MPAVSCCLLLLLLGLATAAGQTLEEDSTSLPAESAARVPARLVANARELAGCIDGAPKRCVLKGDIQLQEGTWRREFPDTGGVASVPYSYVSTPMGENFEITSEPCAPGRASCSPANSNSSVRHTLDLGGLPEAFYIQTDAVLRMSNVRLTGLAPDTAYRGISAAPSWGTEPGTSAWPSIGLAPNATKTIYCFLPFLQFVLVNSSIQYVNPSTESNAQGRDDCAAFTQRRIFGLRQVWGSTNISQINSTSDLVIGPQVINVTIRNTTTDAIVGNATVVYRNVSHICMEKSNIENYTKGVYVPILGR